MFPVTETMYESITGKPNIICKAVRRFGRVHCIRWYNELQALFVLIQDEKGFFALQLSEIGGFIC